MKRRLSSKLITYAMKYFFAPLWISAFGIGTVLFLFAGTQEDPEIKWMFLFGWITGTIICWFSCIRLKHIEIDDEYIYISTLTRRVKVPLSEIILIEDLTLFYTALIWITFSSRTAFGRKIVFMPGPRIYPFQRHPAVDELQQITSRS
jgi:hypothetical protein